MSILSLTFHCPEAVIKNWEEYFNQQLPQSIQGFKSVHQHIFSEVYSEMINEGKNYNLLLFFSTSSDRDDFLNSELLHLKDTIETIFSGEVMTFATLLNTISSSL